MEPPKPQDVQDSPKPVVLKPTPPKSNRTDQVAILGALIGSVAIVACVMVLIVLILKNLSSAVANDQYKKEAQRLREENAQLVSEKAELVGKLDSALKPTNHVGISAQIDGRFEKQYQLDDETLIRLMQALRGPEKKEPVVELKPPATEESKKPTLTQWKPVPQPVSPPQSTSSCPQFMSGDSWHCENCTRKEGRHVHHPNWYPGQCSRR